MDLVAFPPPSTKLGVQRFLGMVNYYRRFVPGMATTLFPLHALASGKAKQVSLEGDSLLAFENTKRKLAAAVLLHHPNPFSETSLTVDASEVAVGAELSQRGPDHQWRPLAFFSHALTKRETKYSAFDRELLAVYLAIRHFKFCLLYTSPSPRD